MLFSANFKLNDEIFGRSVSHGATDTPAKYFIIRFEIGREQASADSHFLPVEPASPLYGAPEKKVVFRRMVMLRDDIRM